MYNTLKAKKCPRCNYKDIGESAFCEKCLCNLIQNKSQEINFNWTSNKL
ncbi:MAG: hypothetical protein ACMXYG_00635 [Candidatus Woesearchaeota archaeon]